MVVIALVMLQPPREEAQTASGLPAAPAGGNEAGCDPATINWDNPAAGGIGPDCKYYPPIVMPPRRVPDALFEIAHGYYTGRYQHRDLDEGKEWLKLAVLRLTPVEIQANRRYAKDHRWDRQFLADMEQAIAWGESLRNAGPREVYDLAKAFRAAGPTGKAPRFASALHHLAIEEGLPEAIFDDAVTKLDDPDRLRRVSAWYGLRQAAMSGYPPALQEITTRLREGRAYPSRDIELFFWLLRSQEAGLPVTESLPTVEARLTNEEQTWVRQRLQRDRWPTEFDW
jgi:hypothetical protein